MIHTTWSRIVEGSCHTNTPACSTPHTQKDSRKRERGETDGGTQNKDGPEGETQVARTYTYPHTYIHTARTYTYPHTHPHSAHIHKCTQERDWPKHTGQRKATRQTRQKNTQGHTKTGQAVSCTEHTRKDNKDTPMLPIPLAAA